MAFRFPLEAVLHLRQSLEHQHELRLRSANQQVVRVRGLIEKVEEKIRQQQAQSAQELSAGTHGAEIRFSLLLESNLRAQRQQLQNELARVVAARDQQQQVFQQARRERESIGVLRDQRNGEYRREQQRREQRALDELFLLRRTSRLGG